MLIHSKVVAIDNIFQATPEIDRQEGELIRKLVTDPKFSEAILELYESIKVAGKKINSPVIGKVILMYLNDKMKEEFKNVPFYRPFSLNNNPILFELRGTEMFILGKSFEGEVRPVSKLFIMAVPVGIIIATSKYFTIYNQFSDVIMKDDEVTPDLISKIVKAIELFLDNQIIDNVDDLQGSEFEKFSDGRSVIFGEGQWDYLAEDMSTIQHGTTGEVLTREPQRDGEMLGKFPPESFPSKSRADQISWLEQQIRR